MPVNFIFELYGLIFQFFKFLLELILNIEVCISQYFWAILIFIKKLVELVHFKVQVFLGNLQFSNLFIVLVNIVVKSYTLLFKNCLSSAQFIDTFLNLVWLSLLFNQLLLVCDPVLVSLSRFIFFIIYLLVDVLKFIFKRSVVLFITLAILSKLSVLPIKTINCELSLFDFSVLGLDIFFFFGNFIFFLMQLRNQVV